MRWQFYFTIGQLLCGDTYSTEGCGLESQLYILDRHTFR